MPITAEFLFLYGSILLIVGLLLSKASYRIGMPILLLFLAVGIFAGRSNLGLEINDPRIAQFIGVIALTIILFSGGMDTQFSDIKPVVTQGILLATVGVLITTVLTGTFIYYLFQYMMPGIQLTYTQALLCAAVMSSTDSASVFSILRSRDIQLKYRLRPILELESGSNDPMAYMLTVILITMIQTDEINVWRGLLDFFLQFSLGAILGYSFGRLSVWLINKINLHTISLYSILLIACAGLTFSVTDRLGGNGYLAVYIAGLVVGNSHVVNRKSMANFFDGFTWLWQLIMFLTLGLLVDVDALFNVAIPAIIIGLFVIFFGRPIAVWLTLIPFPHFLPARGRHYVSWIGLRGAVPIIFATYPWVSNLAHAQLIFNIVFFVTILSLVIQGGTVSWMAGKLSLIDKSARKKVFSSVDLPEEIKSAISEIVINHSMISHGDNFKDLPIPDHTLAIMIQRNGDYFIPKGHTQLQVGDHVLLISDDEEALLQSYEELGISHFTLGSNK